MEQKYLVDLLEIRSNFLKFYRKSETPDIHIDMSFFKLHSIISEIEKEFKDGRRSSINESW